MPDERDRDRGHGRCVVCGGEAAGVASSALGPVSFPYCSTCIEEDADDVGMLVGRTSGMLGNGRSLA